MIFFCSLALFLVIGYYAPNTLRYFVVTPLVGIPFGGLVWAITATIMPVLIAWTTFIFFLIGGMVVTGLFMAKFD